MLDQVRSRIRRIIPRLSLTRDTVKNSQTRTPTELLDLSNDLILKISNNLDLTDLNSLHQASHVLFELLAPALLRRGANGFIIINGPKTRRSILHWASGNGHESLVAKLLDYGAMAHINIQDDGGVTALHSAALCGHTGVVKLLAESGADMESMDRYGWTPLLSVSAKGDHETVELLVELGADVESRGKSGCRWTALHYAAALGRSTVVNSLISLGCRVGAVDVGGMIAAQSAVVAGNVEIAELLSSQGGLHTAPLVTIVDYTLCLKLTEIAKKHLAWRSYWEYRRIEFILAVYTPKTGSMNVTG